MKKAGVIIIVLSIVFGALTIPHKFTRVSASSGPDSGISLKVESSGFGEPEIEKHITGDPSQVRYETEDRWAVSYPALAISLAGLTIGILLVLRSRRRDQKEDLSNQALEATS